MPRTPHTFLRSLTGKTLLHLAIAGTLLLVAAAATNSYLVYRRSESEALLRLSAAAAERARVAERVLGYTIETHEAVKLAFVEKWPRYQNAATIKRFDTILERYPNRIWRNRKELSNGTIYPTGWVPTTTLLTDELRCLLVLFWDLSRLYGPGAALRKDNLFFMSVPEEANLGYDPYLFPNWVFDIPPTFSQLHYEWGRLAYAKAAPGDRARFATPEVDDIGPGPTLGPIFQVLTPVHLNERHVATVATTLMLKEFMARAFPATAPDRRYLLFRADARLFADTGQKDAMAPSSAKATLTQLGGDLPSALKATMATFSEGPRTGYSPASDVYYSIARIDGPDWYIAATLTGAAVRADALRVALWTSLAHIGVLAVLLALLAYILRRDVAAPLTRLTRAAESVAGGNMAVRLPAGRNDELGRLAAAFNDMASRVAERDAALRQDKEKIEAALTSLRLAEERWRAMTEHASDFIAVSDGAGVLRYISPPVHKSLGRDPAELTDRSLIELVHPDDADLLRRQLSQPTGAAIELRILDANGDWRILEARSSDMRSHPAIAGVVFNLRDVTDAVRAEQQLRQAQKLEAIGTLAGGIAHDFNNILAAIIGYGEMAQRDTAPGSALRRNVDQTMSAAMRAKSLVQRILAFSRGGTPERVPVHVQSVVEEALDAITAALPAGIRIESKLDAGDAAISGSATQVHQVVMNLCTNAVQAMKSNGVLTVSLDLVHEPAPALVTKLQPAVRYLRLVVCDTGMGIPRDVLERIFDPFFTTKEIGVGTGLGLSLVHGIVGDLGGHIGVTSEVGKGSTFTVHFPSHGETRPIGLNIEAIPRGEGQTILLIDDDEALVQIGEDLIADLGYEPVGFSSSAEALAAFRETPQRFHAVLTDEALPGLTGSELARQIHEIRPDIPIVLTSGFVSPELHARAHAAGVADVLAKPLVSGEIAHSLARVLHAEG